MKNIKRYIENFNKYKGLLKQLVVRDIKLKYRRSVLGMFWSFLNPLFMMIIMTIVFSKLFNRVENYTVYFLTGKLIFDFYSEATKASMNSVIQNSSLIKKIYIPKYIFPTSKAMSAFVNLIFSLLVLTIMLFITNVEFSLTMLLFPIPLIYIFFISLGIGLILSALTVFFRDIVHLYSVFCLGLMYLTPIFYPADIMPEKYIILQKINPVYHVIGYFRKIILYGEIPTIHENFVCIGFSVIFMILGLFIFYKKQDKFIMHT